MCLNRRVFGFRNIACLGSVIAALLMFGTLAQANMLQERDPAEHEHSSPHTGKIEQVQENQVVLSDHGPDLLTLSVNEHTQITLDGQPAKLSDLKPNDEVSVATIAENPHIAQRIDAKRQRAAESKPEGERPQFRDRGLLGNLLGRQQHGFGISVEPQAGEEGVVVTEVFEETPAHEAGLQRNDLIVSLNGEEIRTPLQLARALRKCEPGDRLKLQIRRAGTDHQVVATLRRRVDAIGRDEHRPRGGLIQQQIDRQLGYRSEPRPWVGIRIGDFDGQGVRIVRVFPGSPAARAGIVTGDVISRIDGQQIHSTEDAAELLDHFKPEDRVRIVLVRNDQQQTRDVRLVDRNRFFEGIVVRRGFRPDGAGTVSEEEEEIPEEAMMLEFHRHLGQQIQRLERMVGELTQEVREMRQQLGQSEFRRQPLRPQSRQERPMQDQQPDLY